MKKKSDKDRGGDLGGGFRSETRKSVISNALQIPFQGVAQVGHGRDRIVITAGLGKGIVRTSIGVNIKF